MQKIKRDLNGSFTVEAALLMTVLIPLLTALIYLGFYQHDKVWIANKTRTEAMEAALDQDRKNQTDWSGVLACGNVSGGVKRGKNKVTATGKATFRIPGFVARFFMGGQMEINSKAEVSVKNAKKQNKKYSTGNIKERGSETKGKRTFCTRKISREKLWPIYISRRYLRCSKNRSGGSKRAQLVVCHVPRSMRNKR